MATSPIRTWLPLDRWAEIIGAHPLHFNQLYSDAITPNNVCGEVWFQEAWQHSDRVGRDDVARAIQQAEMAMAQETGFNLMPDWTIGERMRWPRPGRPELYNVRGTNVRWQRKSIELSKGWIVDAGIRSKTLIQAGVPIVRSDVDTDGFQETCTVNVAVTFTDTDLIAIYYPAQDGDDAWEIRPIKVSISGGNARITFKIWQVVAANQLYNLDPNPILADDPANFEIGVDVYKVQNDTSEQVTFLWEDQPSFLGDCGCGSSDCTACQLGSQVGCVILRDPRRGVVVPAPASYDAADAEHTPTSWAVCREPDQAIISYYSGYRDMKLARPNVTLAPYWETAVAYYAASLLERPVCGCSNVNQFIERWRTSANHYQQFGGFSLTAETLNNKLGTTLGAINAWQRIQQNGMKVNK